MANQFGFLSDETFAEKMDTQNQFLAAMLAAQGGEVVPTSFKQVQTLVRAGLASKVFHIGDQIACNRGSTTLVWDVIGIDHDTPADKQFQHSMTLQLHACFGNGGIQFDAPEALYFCKDGLAAGTYNFSLLAGYDTAYGGGKTYQFTLTKAVPAGGQITFPWGYQVQASATKVSTYESRTSTTALETVSVTEGNGGTGLGTADGNTVNMNHSHRIRYGSNNWKESAMRQFLNSDKAAGSVWTPQTNFDRPPSWVTSQAGFMNGLDADFLAVVGKTRKVTCRNTVTDGGGSDTTDDMFFLLAKPEVYGNKEVSGVDEGTAYPFYSDYSDYTRPTVDYNEPDSNRIKYYQNGNAAYWWLRTPSSGYGYHVRHVITAGDLSSGSAYHSNGVAPACNII